MMRNWKLLGLSTVVVVVLAAAPVPAGSTDGVLPQRDLLKALQDKLDEMNLKLLPKAFDTIDANLKALREDVKALANNDADTKLKVADVQLRVARVEKHLLTMRNELDALRKGLPSTTVAQYPPNDKAALDEIRTRLSQLQDAINRLQPGTDRVAFSAPLTTGRLVFVNLHGEELLLVVGQRSWRVAPGTTRVVEQPAGAVTYEVISPTYGLMRRNTPVLKGDDTVTVTAR